MTRTTLEAWLGAGLAGTAMVAGAPSAWAQRDSDPARIVILTGGEAPAPASTDLTMKLRQALVDIQYGRAEDTFGWMHRIC